MIYVYADSLNEFRQQKKIIAFAKLDSTLEETIFNNRHLFEQNEIEFWISLDPYGDTLIDEENIIYLLKFGEKLSKQEILTKIKNSDWFKLIEDDYSINEIEEFANNLVKGCKFAISNNKKIISSGD